MKQRTVFLLLFMPLLLSACSAPQGTNAVLSDVDPVLLRAGQTASSNVARSVSDIITSEWHNQILLVEFLTPGEYTITESSQAFVFPGLEDVTVTSCGAETQVKVLQVYKGDAALVGQTIILGEALLPNDDGEYESRYIADTTITRAIICANKQDSYNAYVCNTPEHEIFPVDADGEVTIWPYLEGADTCSTLDAFSSAVEIQASAQLQTVQPQNDSAPQGAYETVPLTEAQIEAFTYAFNQPANNGLLRSCYFIVGGMDVNEALAGGMGAPTTAATAEELAAYAVATGVAEPELIKLSDEVFRSLMGRLGLGEYSWASHWIYLEEYDAWFSPDTTYTLLEVTCTSGYIEQNLFYYVMYEFNDSEGTARTGKVCVAGIREEIPLESTEFWASQNYYDP